MPLPDTSTGRLPAVTDTAVHHALHDLYGIQGTIEPLYGERDKNYKVTIDDGQGIRRYVFKIANIEEDLSMLECQQQVFDRLKGHQAFEINQSIISNRGNTIETITCDTGAIYHCRLTTWLEGDLFASINPHHDSLLEHLGQTVAQIDLALEGFSHPALDRPLWWRMQDAEQVIGFCKPLIKDREQLALLNHFQTLFQTEVLANADSLRQGAIHNDANDNNIIVEDSAPWEQRIKGLIDFGDMVCSWLIADLAVACSYALLEKSHPLDTAATIIRGYHQTLPLKLEEIQALYAMIAMRLCMSVCICAHQIKLDPENEYLSISNQPAWDALTQLKEIPAEYAHYVFRDACGLAPITKVAPLTEWLNAQSNFASIVNLDLKIEPLLMMDTSVSSPHVSAPMEGNEYDSALATRTILRALEDTHSKAGIGRYDEYRLIYDSDDFIDFSNHRRTLHLGIDIFQPVDFPIFAPLDGMVHSLAFEDAPFDYGGVVILEHTAELESGEAINFYTLYGHLRPSSFEQLNHGDQVIAGQQIATMGDFHENGNWSPHVHFEIITDLLCETHTFPGVGNHAHRNVWLNLCPDPNLILRIPEHTIKTPLSDSQRNKTLLLNKRQQHLSNTLSLSYSDPIVTARGAGQYLFDATGRRYLDAVNNVPHVGHCHPHVIAASQMTAGVLSTNTRYLYPQITDYAERLLVTFPDPLSVVFLVNSGSEANDLALRLARTHTNRQNTIILDHAYHGNLSALIDLSPYKHNGKGGQGAPSWVYTAPIPDTFRGAYSTDDPDHAKRYAQSVIDLIEQAEIQEQPVAAFICESILGCGGQVVLPDGYLEIVYAAVRAAGGVCIADEVQTGFGRVGSHFWAFETQNVMPDIVTIGKPAGNGHPLAAVITTQAIADSFNTGMEYFNTFGGNPISCAIGSAVLDVIATEGLQQNAEKTGRYLMEQLIILQRQFPLIGEVRGQGLFIGVELINDKQTKTPAEQQASYIAERMKQCGVLISTDGPYHNVLKIKPPLVFNRKNVDTLVAALNNILSENWAQPQEL